jgi:Leucine-rich repeat (LRR) protein
MKTFIAYRTQVATGGMDTLKGLVELQWLHLNSNDVNDESIAALNSLTGLERLDLDNARFTDEGIKDLRLPKLKQLSLDGCIGITDAGLANFSGMPAVETLMLGGTGVAGIDLTPLSNLPNLKEVRLLGNQFKGNDDSIRALKAKLPKCEVVIMRG